MRIPFLIKRTLTLAIAVAVGSMLQTDAWGQNEDQDQESLKIQAVLPSGDPAAKATVVRHAQFSSGKPAWIRQRTGTGRDSQVLIANEKGQLTWPAFDIGRSSPICMILSSDQKSGAFLNLEGIDLTKTHSVKLTPLRKFKATFKNPQADRIKVPFLHRGYIYLVRGSRFAHVVGESATIQLPTGHYQMTGYNGNGHNIQVQVPKFKLQFEVTATKVKDLIALEGTPKIQADATGNSLGTVCYEDGIIEFKANSLLADYQGEVPFKISFQGPDGKPYRGKRVFVRDIKKRNTFVYYGKMPENGTLDLGNVVEGTYRVEVDGHTPSSCYRIKVNEDLKLEQPIVMPVMPGYSLDNLHLLDPESMEKKDLKGYRGKVVYIEFWASWCGPCMQAMNHVEAILSKKKGQWGDRVALVAVNVNEDPAETIEKFTKIHGWNSFQHLYGGDVEKNDFNAPSLKQLQINGIPHAMILGADGKMIWRGHPESIDVGVEIEKALKAMKK